MARQVFTKAFKIEAVRLLDAGKQPAAAIARELGIKREKLYAWRTQLRERGPDAFHDRPGRPAADGANRGRSPDYSPRTRRGRPGTPGTTRRPSMAPTWAWNSGLPRA